MSSLDTQDANIIEQDAVNWRLVVYPLVGFIVLLLGGLGIYYYQQGQRDQEELQARQAILAAKTPEDLRQVADRFSTTTQADLALMSAADLSVAQKDFAGAAKSYQQVADASGADPVLRDSANIGLASTYEAEQKPEDALKIYLTVARRGKDSPYSPYAYTAAARIYDEKKDIANERAILTEAAGLGVDSDFVKEAAFRLKKLNAQSVPASSAPVTH